MEYFDIIENDYNSADETINFGTRIFGCENLYEICTIACLKSSQNDKVKPEELPVKSIIQNGKVFINVADSIKVFEDKNLSALIFNSLFEAVIDTFLVSPDGRFLLVCLGNGSVNIIDISQENATLVAKMDLEEAQASNCFAGCFIEKIDETTISFLIVSNKGVVNRIMLNNMNEASGSIEVIKNQLFNFSFNICLCEFNYPKLFVNGQKASVLDIDNLYSITSDALNITKIYNVGLNFLGLDNNGNFVRICALTLLAFPIDSPIVYEDILVISDNNIQIIGITKKDINGNSQMHAISYPDLKSLYNLKIKSKVHLTNLESSTDDIMFLTEISKNGNITELRFQEVSETQPELRVEKLIRKHRFEEAEQFAKNFNVNPIIIKKARAQLISETVLCSTDDVNCLIKLLDEIDDDFFKLQCCKLVDCAEVNDVRRILAYGCSLNIKNSMETKEECIALQNVLVDLLYKFDTFMSVYDTYDMDKWTPFASADLIEQLKELLKSGEIESAIILFSRLDITTMKKLTNEKIEEVLFIISNLPMNLLMPFLPTFITITIVQKPESLPLFVKWLYNKILIMEKRQVHDFPDCGIRFSKYIIQLMKVDNQTNMAFQRQCMLNKQCLNKLQNLLSALKDIQHLKNNFRINIPISKYLMGSKEVISTLLDVHLNLEEFKLLLNNFLCDFIIRNQFEPDKIFLNEIKSLVKLDEVYWVDTVEVLLNYISSVEIKLTAIKEVLENAKVPWSPKVKNMGKSASNYSHSLSEEIKKQLKNEDKLMVLRNPKYGLKEKHIIDIKDLKFVVNRILYKNEPSSIEDCLKLCESDEEKYEINILLIQNCIRKGENERAISILKQNSSEEIYKCAKWLTNYARIIIDYNDIVEVTDNYQTILGPLYTKLIENTRNNIEKAQYACDLADLRGVCNLRKHFSKHVISADMIVPDIRKTRFEEILEDIVVNFHGGSVDFLETIRQCGKLASSFSMEKNSVIMKFCEKISNIDILLKAADYLYDNNCNSQNLCLMCMLLLQRIGSCDTTKISFEESTVNFLIPSNNDISGNDFIGGLIMAEKLIKKAVLLSTPEDHTAIVEVMNWVNVGFYLIRSKRRGLKSELFKNMYQTDSIISGVTTFTAINKTFEIYCRYIEQSRHPSTKLLTTYFRGFDPLSEDEFMIEVQNMIPVINELCREGQQLTAYNLVMTLQKGLVYESGNNPDVKKLVDCVIKKKCLPQLIHAVASAKHIDEILFYNLLVLNGKSFSKYINQYIKLYRRQPSKACMIALVGVKLMEHFEISAGIEHLLNHVICCKWWKKVESKDICFDKFFTTNPKDRLETMMAADCIDVNSIKEYCNDFKLDLQLCYIEFLAGILKNWKPEIETTKLINGEKNIIVKNNEKVLIKKCMEVVDAITSKEKVLKLIRELWSKINNYYYEVYICMLDIENKLQQSTEVPLQQVDTTRKLLFFLKRYSRVSSEKHNPLTDPLSEYRLPFTTTLFTTDIWNIIRPELNLKTYKQWFTAHYILKNILSKDDICSFAIKNVVSSGIFSQDPNVKWYLYPRYEDLFHEIAECVRHITDLEKATATVYHLMDSMPCGADKVNAAQLSYDYALRYREQLPGSDEVIKIFMKVKNKYYRYSAVHILYMYQLADEKYLNLVGQPADLINALYKDERIIQKSKCISVNCPDINSAVDELCKLFDIEVYKTRYFIVKSCLSHSNSDIDLDSTATIPCMQGNQMTISDDYLARAMYVCTSGDLRFWQDYLLGAGSEDLESDDSDLDNCEAKEPKSLLFRANALKCFCALSDVDTITELTGVTYNEFLESVDKLILRSEFEKFGIVMDMLTLDDYDKKELLKKLAKFGSQSAIKVMGMLSVIYNIDDMRFWEFIISRAISWAMFDELKYYVEFLKDKSFKRFHVEAWQAILDNAFNVPDDLSPEEIQKLYIKNFLTIQTCPVLYSMNFEKIISKCIYANRADFAALLLQYFPENLRIKYGKQILQTQEIYKKLEALKSHGIWGVRKANIILGQVKEALEGH